MYSARESPYALESIPQKSFSLRETALALFGENQARKKSSTYEKFKADWKRDAKKRLILGVTLAG